VQVHLDRRAAWARYLQGKVVKLRGLQAKEVSYEPDHFISELVLG